MASSDEGRTTRHVGSIVDPSVRADGIDEPELNLAPPPPPAETPATAAPSESESESESELALPEPPAPSETGVLRPLPTSSERAVPGHTLLGSQSRRGQAMRDRLLERARVAANPVLSATSEGVSDDSGSEGGSGFQSLRGVEDALDRVAARGRSATTQPIRLAGAELSPNVIALFGTVFGLATVASLFAVLLHFAPRDGVTITTSPSAETAPVSPPDAPAALPLPGMTEAPKPVPTAAPTPGPWRIEQAVGVAGQRVLRGRIGSEPFLKAIQTAGLGKNEAYRVFKALKSQRDLDRCKSGDQFLALVDRPSGRVLAFEYVVSAEEVFQVREQPDGTLAGKQLDMLVVKRRVQAAIQIADSFSASARAVGFNDGLGEVIDRALEGHASIRELARGDVLRVVAVEVSVLNRFARYDGVEALELLRAADGKPTRIYYFPGSSSRYVDARGRAPGLGEWTKPCKGAPITSHFNPKRFHPILKKIHPHTGTDFGAPTGTPVLATKGGKVTFIGAAGANGNYVNIEHGGGYESGYSHLSRFEAGVKVGDVVRRQQVIGYVGSTGRSTGPHLHFSVKKDGKFIDAETLSLDGLSVLPSAERAQVSELRAKYDPLLDAIALPPPLEPVSAPVAAGAPNPDATDDDLAAGEPGAASAPVAPAPLPAPAPGGPAPGGPAVPVAVPLPAPALPPTGAGPSLYMSDQELLGAQPTNDDGEVDE